MDEDRNRDTGLRIRRARERAGLSREQLGEQVGRSLRAVGAWERGENLPQNLGLLSETLGVDLDRSDPEPGVLLRDATNGQLLGELADRLDRNTNQ